MSIPTEPSGGIPRPRAVLDAVSQVDGTDPILNPLYDAAIRETIELFEATGDDTTTSRETAFAKIRSRVLGTQLASEILGVE